MKNTRTAVITGSSKGIGYAITKRLLDLGYEVHGISRSKLAGINNNSYHHISFDLTNFDDMTSLIMQLPETIDLLINNAGAWELVFIRDITEKHFQRMIDLNLKAPVFLTKSLLSKIPAGSTVINISSIMGRFTDPEYTIYSCAKSGLDRFTTSLARERKDLLVVGILPSATDTEANRKVLGDSENYSTYLTPDEIAKVVIRAINKEFPSGQLVVVNNKEFMEMWNKRDKYVLIDVDG